MVLLMSKEEKAAVVFVSMPHLSLSLPQIYLQISRFLKLPSFDL